MQNHSIIFSETFSSPIDNPSDLINWWPKMDIKYDEINRGVVQLKNIRVRNQKLKQQSAMIYAIIIKIIILMETLLGLILYFI